MFIMEQPMLTEQEVYHWIQEYEMDPAVVQLREEILNPVIEAMQDPEKMKKYIDLGSEFIETNGEMLAKPYPTSRVQYPRKYVDRVLDIFGYTTQSAKTMIRDMLKKYINESDFLTIVSYPTNVIHVAVLVYCDMLTDKKQIKDDRNNLRDSARQQLGLTVYGAALAYQFPLPDPQEKIMEYTYNHLDRSWNLVRCENMITWIGNRIEVTYGFYRSKMSLNLSPKVLVDVLNRFRNSFRQDLRSLANQYYADRDEKKSMGDDISGSEESSVEKSELIQIRSNLLRKISSGDNLYTKMGKTYKAIADLKNVRVDKLFDFAQKIDKKDIGKIIDAILYVYITKEENTIESINSAKFIGRITKFPTAIDRAISGKPIILPLVEKYDETANIVKAYICFIATYMLQRINDLIQK